MRTHQVFKIYNDELAMNGGRGVVKPNISETMYAQICISTWNVLSMRDMHANIEHDHKGT